MKRFILLKSNNRILLKWKTKVDLCSLSHVANVSNLYKNQNLFEYFLSYFAGFQ